MMQVSFTHVQNSPSGSQNDDVQFPQEFSLFYAGEISDHAGSFAQVTYEQASGNFGWDNTDIRYANELPDSNLTYGLTLNNSPTVQDVWNTGPVWGYPWSGPGDAAPAGPTVQPFIGSEDFVALSSGGLGIYGLWNDTIYAELTAYRSAHVGTAAPDGGSNQTITNVAPYWRLAWEHAAANGDNLMVGTYGMWANFHPNGIDGQTDRYIDTALDTQYQHPFASGDSLSVHASITHEDQDIHSTGTADSLSFNSAKVDGTYHLGSHATATLAYFNTWGDKGAYYPGYVNGDGDPLNPTPSGTGTSIRTATAGSPRRPICPGRTPSSRCSTRVTTSWTVPVQARILPTTIPSTSWRGSSSRRSAACKGVSLSGFGGRPGFPGRPL